MSRRWRWVVFLVLAAAIRLLTQGWDSGLLSPHPDERQVAFVAERTTGWLADPGFFAYGSLHFRAVRLAAALLGREPSYAGLILGGRTLSLLASLLALALGFAVARKAWGERTAALFLLLAAFVPLDIQQSHFATVEAHHALWVTAALAACWWLAEAGSAPAAAAAGLAAGASLAVKVSSLGLAAPLAVALLLAARRRGAWRAAMAASLAAAAGVAAFWLGEPWAFAGARPPLALVLGLAAAAFLFARAAAGPRTLGVAGLAAAAGTAVAARLAGPAFNPEFLAGVAQQVAMVTGRTDLPYVRVYRHTLPVLYPLRELGLWGLGPGLLPAALAGCALGAWWLARRRRRWLAGRWSSGAALALILLAWVVPTAARLATLQVKYLRYWEPLVVPLTLLAAWVLTRLRRPAVGRAVAGLTALWGIAFLWAFAAPHPHRTAADWLNRMVAPGQTVAFETWDEELPLRVAARRVALPSYDLPDSPAKARRWCRTLAGADWVVLTSNRIRRTLFANRDRFPRTARLYALLLAGRAGFEPLLRVERGPRLFGLRFPVQAADESFVNYDFPRVVILRRVGRVDPGALAAAAERPLPFLAGLGPGAAERRLVNPLPRLEAPPGAASQAAGLLAWIAVFTLLAGAAWILAAPLTGALPDGGLGLAAVSGWIGVSWLPWIGARAGIWPATAAVDTSLFLALLAAAAVAARSRRTVLAAIWRRRRRGMLLVAAVGLAVGALFLAVRLFNPAIFWGEKPMDFTFLNAFVRAPSWPPGEPWMAGMPLHYYAFGEVLAAVPIRLAGVPTAAGYNLMAATIPALAAVLLAGLGLAFARRRTAAAAWLLPLLALLSGNLAWPFLLDLARSGRWFDLWWATSRVIPGYAIDEYPLWTALFADLHAHFIALPVALAALAWGWLAVRRHRHGRAAAVALGVTMAALAATNPWDVILTTAALGVGCLAAARRPGRGILRLALAAFVAAAAGVPFLADLAAWLRAGVGGGGLFLTAQDFAPAGAVLEHLGLFLVPLLTGAVVTGARWLWVGAPLAVIGVAAGLGFGSPAAAVGLAAAALLAAAARAEDDLTARLAWCLAALAMLAVVAAERFTLMDRMNTLFKLYNGIWVLLALALGVLLLRLRRPRRLAVLLVWLPLEAVGLVNLPLGIVQGIVQPRMASPRPTLDGTAYLPAADPQTWFLVRALGAARPGDVIAEAAGPSYQRYTRLSMMTGLPTVVGWTWHLEQRGQPAAEIAARRRDLAALYTSPDPAVQRRIIDRYRIHFIALAGLERRTYGITAADPFAGVPGVVRLGGSRGAVLYLVLPPGCATIPG